MIQSSARFLFGVFILLGCFVLVCGGCAHADTVSVAAPSQTADSTMPLQQTEDTELMQSIVDECAWYEDWQYSAEHRDVPGFCDCSSFVGLVYRCVTGISFGGDLPEAAEIYQWCEDQNCVARLTDKASLLPGDLLFWERQNTGRYKNISHVAIYAGEGLMWESAGSTLGVTCREIELQDPECLAWYARPLLTVQNEKAA